MSRAFRRLRRRPGFAGAVVAILALAVGAVVTVTAAVRASLLAPLPYRDADRLVFLWHGTAEAGERRIPIPAPDVAEFRERSRLFEGFAFVDRADDVALGAEEGPARVRLAAASSDFFRLLGVEAARGRTFLPGEGRLSPETLEAIREADEEDLRPPRIPPGPVVFDHGFWHRRFGGDPAVLGRTVRLGDQVYEVIGILPADFELLLPPDAGIPVRVDAWTPVRVGLAELRREEGFEDQDADNTGAVVGRLRPAVTVSRAGAEMERIAARQRADRPAYARAGVQVRVGAVREEALGHARPLLLALLAGAALLLAIACLNLTNLFLVRGLHGRKDAAVRIALGAGRGDLLRDRAWETLLLGLGGGLGGLVLASWGVGLVRGLPEGVLPRAATVGLDPALALSAPAVALLGALLSGLVPAIRLSRPGAVRALREHGPGGSGPGGPATGGRLRGALVAGQIALSLTLLAGTGLLVRTVANLGAVQPGFQARDAVTFRLGRLVDRDRYRGPADRARFVHELEERIGRLPGVEAVGTTGILPLSGLRFAQPWGRAGEGPGDWAGRRADFRVVTAEYFRAAGTRLVAGREFTEREEVEEDRRIAIVDERLARRLAPEAAGAGAAVGRSMVFPLDGDPVEAEVVGVVETVRAADLREAGRETLYVPYRQEASRSVALVVRAASDPGVLVPAARAELRALDPELPLYDVRTLEAFVAEATAPGRLALALTGLFAAAAVLLAAVGLYGVVSYAVGRRARELGIRAALGARPRDLLRSVLAGGLRVVAPGILLGLLAAAAGTRALSGLLFGVSPLDIPTYAAVAALLGAVALAAVWIPARRAARADPAATLREG